MSIGFFPSFKRFDWILAGAVTLLLVLSSVILYSISLSKAVPDFLNFKKQILKIAPTPDQFKGTSNNHVRHEKLQSESKQGR